MTTLRDRLEANDWAWRAARGHDPRTAQDEMTIGHLEQERELLVRRALASRDRDALSWLAAHDSPNARAVAADRHGGPWPPTHEETP